MCHNKILKDIGLPRQACSRRGQYRHPPPVHSPEQSQGPIGATNLTFGFFKLRLPSGTMKLKTCISIAPYWGACALGSKESEESEESEETTLTNLVRGKKWHDFP